MNVVPDDSGWWQVIMAASAGVLGVFYVFLTWVWNLLKKSFIPRDEYAEDAEQDDHRADVSEQRITRLEAKMESVPSSAALESLNIQVARLETRFEAESEAVRDGLNRLSEQVQLIHQHLLDQSKR